MKPFPGFSFSINPWIYFFIFGLTNCLLSYGSLSVTSKWEAGFFGLILPSVMAIFSKRPVSWFETGPQKEFLPPLTLWIWILIGAMAVYFRFYNLTTLSVWPHYDEGVYGYYANQLSEKWDWRMFYGDSRVPPLYIWILSWTFRILGTSLFSLWLLPALVSVLAVPMAFLASRRFFSSSYSLVFTLQVALSIWPWLLGRFSFMTGMILLAELLAFFLLGHFLCASSKTKNKWALGLGLFLGSGFLIHIHWPVIALFVVAILLSNLKAKGETSKSSSLFWALPLLFLFVPFLVLCLNQGYASCLGHWAPFHQSTSWVDQAAISLSYLSSLFWGLDTSFHTYQPVWGGYLNPVLGSLFLIGLLKACKNFQSVLNRWLLAGGILFILPGVLTSDRETFRMVPLIPILFMVTSLGLGQLLVSSSVRKNAWIVSLVFLFSTGLDFHHLEKYHRLWDSMDNWKGYAKSWERYKAYGILEQINREEGPGLIFSDLTPGLCDQTLNVADDGFNALENRLLHPNQARWVAVLVNVNEKPFLEKRFSGSRSYALSREDRPPDGGLMLWTVPLSESNRPAFLPWVRFQQALKPFIDESLGYIQGQSYSRSLDLLAEALPMMEGDPFLLSRYWNLRADLLVKAGDLAESEISLQNVVKQGDPSADLYYRLGVLQWLQGKKGLASKSFDSAVHAPLNLTASTQWLESHP